MAVPFPIFEQNHFITIEKCFLFGILLRVISIFSFHVNWNLRVYF